jgi:hypothetical protein
MDDGLLPGQIMAAESAKPPNPSTPHWLARKLRLKQNGALK